MTILTFENDILLSWRNYISYRTLQKHEVHHRHNTIVTFIIETYTAVVLLFAEYQMSWISWFIKNLEI